MRKNHLSLYIFASYFFLQNLAIGSELDKTITDSKNDNNGSVVKEEAIRIIDKICRRTFLQVIHYPFYNTGNSYYMLGRHINRLRRKYCILNNPDDYRVEKSHLIWGIMSVFNLFIKDTSIIDLCETILFIGDYTYIRKVQVRQLIHFAFYSIYSLEEQDEIYNFVTGVTSSVQIGACIFRIQHGELVVNSEMVWVFTLPYIVNSPETDNPS